MPQYNSTYISCAYSLNVPIYQLQKWVESFDHLKKDRKPISKEYIDTETEVEMEIEKTNPMLAQKWRTVKFLQEKGLNKI